MTNIDPATTTAAYARANPQSRSKTEPRTGKTPTVRIAAGKPISNPPLPTSKSTTVIKLLSRAKGATVEELITETGWQPHSVRAFFTGLRKKGYDLVREQRKGGEHAYRILTARRDAASAAHVTEAAAAQAATETATTASA